MSWTFTYIIGVDGLKFTAWHFHGKKLTASCLRSNRLTISELEKMLEKVKTENIVRYKSWFVMKEDDGVNLYLGRWRQKEDVPAPKFSLNIVNEVIRKAKDDINNGVVEKLSTISKALSTWVE